MERDSHSIPLEKSISPFRSISVMELRSAKRRKVSNAKVRVTVEIDKKAQTAKDEILESPKQTASASDDELIAVDVDGSDVQKAPSARTTKSTRRKVALKSDAKATATQSPSKGTRSRERPRELAQPRDEEASESSRKNTGSSSRKSRTTRTGSTRSKHVDISEPDEVDDEPSEPERRVTRGRSRQAAKKATGSTSGKDEVQADTGSPDLSGEPDDSYDPVAAQLQQDIEPNVAVHDETQETDEPLPTYAEKFQKACESRRQELEILSRFVLEKLTGKRLPPLKGLNSEYQKVYQLIEQTVTAGEGNSMLIMGSRGSGKTAMVESIIAKLSKTNKDDFHVVRLNGFLQTDDRLALREIWRQLGRETNTEDEASKINSYADTMATLLALLSHPEEIFGKSDNPDTVTTAKSVIIILDEFDLFAAHHRQTLLYNLFDIAQARKAPLAVIGLTTKVDVTENLEKRVKSRFSHRYVFLPLPKTFEAFSEICLSGLSVADEELEDESVSELKSSKGKKVVESWNTFLKVGHKPDTQLMFADCFVEPVGRRAIQLSSSIDILQDEVCQRLLCQRFAPFVQLAPQHPCRCSAGSSDCQIIHHPDATLPRSRTSSLPFVHDRIFQFRVVTIITATGSHSAHCAPRSGIGCCTPAGRDTICDYLPGRIRRIRATPHGGQSECFGLRGRSNWCSSLGTGRGTRGMGKARRLGSCRTARRRQRHDGRQTVPGRSQLWRGG